MDMTKELILQNRKTISKKQRAKNKNIKFKHPPYPHNVEVQLYKFIQKYLDGFISEIMFDLSLDKIAEFTDELNIDSFKADANLLAIFSDAIRKMKEKISSSFKEGTTAGDNNRMIVSQLAFSLAGKSENYFKGIFKKLVGFEYAPVANWERDVISVWAENNYTLIQNLADENIKEINRIVSSGVLSGRDSKVIYKQILAKNKTMKQARAKLIARDQVSKLQGEFTKRRMKDAGFDMYIWSTSGDERVRDSHAVLNGMICRWDDDTVYSLDGETWFPRKSDMFIGHPGDDFQCRCSALAYTPRLFDEIDNEIDNRG